MLKIFVSVGTRFAMDRLVSAVDEFVFEHSGFEAFAQIGNSAYKAKAIKCEQFLDGETFLENVRNADIVVSHAGMGNILLALEYSKKIIIMPRQSDLGEHINNHQVDTVKGVASSNNVFAINEKNELAGAITWATSNDSELAESQLSTSPEKLKLIESLSSFIDNA